MSASSGYASRHWSRRPGIVAGICIPRRSERRAGAVAFLASGCSLFVHSRINATNYINGSMFLVHLILSYLN